MVRNLMMILGVSFAVAAFGCSDDPGGTGGTGGNVDPCIASGMDACLNENDLPLLCDSLFNAEVQICATAAVGDCVETSRCVQDSTGASKDCADCYGETTACTLEHCIAPPAFCATTPFSAECVACREEFCVPAFDACRGDFAPECPALE